MIGSYSPSLVAWPVLQEETNIYIKTLLLPFFLFHLYIVWKEDCPFAMVVVSQHRRSWSNSDPSLTGTACRWPHGSTSFEPRRLWDQRRRCVGVRVTDCFVIVCILYIIIIWDRPAICNPIELQRACIAWPTGCRTGPRWWCSVGVASSANYRRIKGGFVRKLSGKVQLY